MFEYIPFLATITVIFLMITVDIINTYSLNRLLIPTNCNITNVIYPKQLPINSSDYTGFINCDCGRNCISDLGTCVSVFGNIVNSSEKIILLEDIYDKNKICTITNDICLFGEKISDRMDAIDEAKKVAKTYLNLINTSIDCYFDEKNNNLYFSNYFNTTKLIVLSSITSVLLLILSISLFIFYRKMDNLHQRPSDNNN